MSQVRGRRGAGAPVAGVGIQPTPGSFYQPRWTMSTRSGTSRCNALPIWLFSVITRVLRVIVSHVVSGESVVNRTATALGPVDGGQAHGEQTRAQHEQRPGVRAGARKLRRAGRRQPAGAGGVTRR